MAKLGKKGLTFLKIVFSILLLYFIFTKIQFQEIITVAKQTKPLYLLLALLLFVVSKVIASLRLNLYLHQLEVFLSQLSNLKLYLLGMFYNLFLPGGIGGDAYKGYVIKKKFQAPTARVVSILVLDRLSGLLLLFTYACILAFFLEHEAVRSYKYLFIVGILAGTFVFFILNKKRFTYVFPVFWRSLAYSALVQLAQLISLWCILISLDITSGILPYLLIFLISSIVSVVPLTIGGIGSRELVFFYGALWLGLEENTSVAISIVFFLITALVSLSGIFYHFKKPELEVINTS